MRVYVNDEKRELRIIDRASGKNVAKMVVCSQERLDKNEYDEFVMTEEEFTRWQSILDLLQDADDLRLSLLACVQEEEMNDYLYEETKYLTNMRETAETELRVLGYLQQALDSKNHDWLKEYGFVKTDKSL